MARRIRQADIIRAEYPTARSRYFSDLNLGLQKKALEQSQRQFDAQTALQKQAMEDAEQQAQQSQAIATLGLAKSAYPYAKKGISGLSRKVFGSEKGGAQAIQDLFKPEYETPGMTDLYGTPVETGTGEAAAPSGEQAIQDLYKPAYPTRDYQSLIDSTNVTGLGESAIAPGYEAGTAALMEAIRPAYTIPSLEALYSEGAAQAAPAIGAGEAAIPAAEGTVGGVDSALGAGSSTPIGWILAAIAAQHGLAGATDRVVEGQRVGDVFSVDDQGRWSPWFANDPWHEYLGSQWGFERPSGGVNFEAAVKNSDWNTAAKRVPQAFNQWADPIGDFGYDVAEGAVKNWTGSDQLASAAGFALNPFQPTVDKLGEAEDIGDAAMAFLDPIGILGGTHFCTAITNSIGMSKIQTAMMKIFRNWCLENHRSITEHYMKYGGELVQKIKDSIENEQAYFAELKKIVVDKVLSFMAKDDIQSAYETYREKYLELLKIYTPELFPGLSRAEMPGE